MTPRDLFKQILLADLGSVPRFQNPARHKPFRIIAKSPGLVCGTVYIETIIDVVRHEFFLRDHLEDQHPIGVRIDKGEGKQVLSGNWIVELVGNAEILLKSERTICNLVSKLSGIATYTDQCVRKLKEAGYGKVRLYDTRKSLSILRPLTQYAFSVGGGHPHRLNMDDGTIVKDNDIAIFGGISKALNTRLKQARALHKTEIEISNFKELDILLEDAREVVIMLDNMSLEDMTKAVQIIRDVDGHYKIEASGIGSHDLVAVARTGVDYISSSSFVTQGEGNPLDVSMKCIG